MIKDLTMREAIADDMIALVNAADGMDQPTFADLLESVARRLSVKCGNYGPGAFSAACKPDAPKVGISTTEILRGGFQPHAIHAHTDDPAPIPGP